MNSTDTRSRLVAAASQLIGEKGLAAVTVKAIAQRAGCNHGLVHYFFRSKEDLLIAALETLTETYSARFDLIDARLSGPDLVRAAFALAAEILRADPWRLRLHAELIATGLRREDLAPSVTRLIILKTERTAELVATAYGRTRPSEADRQTGAFLSTAFDGIAIQAAFDPEFKMDDALAALSTLVMNAMPSSNRQGEHLT